MKLLNVTVCVAACAGVATIADATTSDPSNVLSFLTGDPATDEMFIRLLGQNAEKKGCSASNSDIQHNALRVGEVHDMAQQRSTARRGRRSPRFGLPVATDPERTISRRGGRQAGRGERAIPRDIALGEDLRLGEAAGSIYLVVTSAPVHQALRVWAVRSGNVVELPRRPIRGA